MDGLGAVRLFLRAVEAGTISGAGRLGLSSTAASRALQELETAPGLRLLDRTTRRLSPTEAGRRLHARLTPLLSDLDAALREAADLHEQPRGLLRVSARRSFGMLHVVPAVASFRTVFPQVETAAKCCGRRRSTASASCCCPPGWWGATSPPGASSPACRNTAPTPPATKPLSTPSTRAALAPVEAD